MPNLILLVLHTRETLILSEGPSDTYSSAISASFDIVVNQYMSIKFLPGIRRAQIDEVILAVILKVNKEYSDNMIEQIGIEPYVSEDGMKKYVNDELQEIKAGKKKISS
jgi:hypothetical protein